MKAEIKKQWLDALRNGKYGQLDGVLRASRGTLQGYCCLGVLCDLHAQATGAQWDADTDTYMGFAELLPSAVCAWAGLSYFKPSTSPTCDGFDVAVTYFDDAWIADHAEEEQVPEKTTLASLNDEGKTFLEIADIIEKEL